MKYFSQHITQIHDGGDDDDSYCNIVYSIYQGMGIRDIAVDFCRNFWFQEGQVILERALVTESEGIQEIGDLNT